MPQYSPVCPSMPQYARDYTEDTELSVTQHRVGGVGGRARDGFLSLGVPQGQQQAELGWSCFPSMRPVGGWVGAGWRGGGRSYGLRTRGLPLRSGEASAPCQQLSDPWFLICKLECEPHMVLRMKTQLICGPPHQQDFHQGSLGDPLCDDFSCKRAHVGHSHLCCIPNGLSFLYQTWQLCLGSSILIPNLQEIRLRQGVKCLYPGHVQFPAPPSRSRGTKHLDRNSSGNRKESQNPSVGSLTAPACSATSGSWVTGRRVLFLGQS